MLSAAGTNLAQPWKRGTLVTISVKVETRQQLTIQIRNRSLNKFEHERLLYKLHSKANLDIGKMVSRMKIMRPVKHNGQKG